MLSSMCKSSVIVEVAIWVGLRDLAGDDARRSNLRRGRGHPLLRREHPGAIPLTSSHTLNNATLPFGLALANKGVAAVLERPHLRADLNVCRGRLTYKAIAECLGLPFSPIEQAAACSQKSFTGRFLPDLADHSFGGPF